MIKIAICDDQQIVTEHMSHILLNHKFDADICVDCFTSGLDLYESALKIRYNIIIIDIELSKDAPETIEGNGMFISQKIKNMYPEVMLVFFTGCKGYKHKLLSYESFAYLQKPFYENDLIEIVERAIRRLKGLDERFFKYKIGALILRVNINEIIMFNSRSPYIIITTFSEKMEFRGKIDDVEKTVRNMSNDFVRVSKGYLINCTYITKYTTKKVILVNGIEINISRKYLKEFLMFMQK